MISDAAVTSDVYVILIEFFYIVLLMDTHTAYIGNKAPIRYYDLSTGIIYANGNAISSHVSCSHLSLKP